MLKELSEIDSSNIESSSPCKHPIPNTHSSKSRSKTKSKKTSRNDKTPIRKKISLLEYSNTKSKTPTKDSLLPRSNSSISSSFKTSSSSKEKEHFVLSHSLSKQNNSSIITQYPLRRNKSYNTNHNINRILSLSTIDIKPYIHKDISFTTNKISNKHSRNNSLMNLSMKLSYIKTNVINNYKNDINIKKAQIISLEKSISSLKQKIHIYNNNKRYWNIENSKIVNSLETLKLTAKRFQQLNEDIVKRNEGMQYYGAVIREIKLETDSISKEWIIRSIDNEVLKEDIRVMNKKISEIRKEKEKMKIQLDIINKKIKKIKGKISLSDSQLKLVESKITHLYKGKLII